MNTAVKVWMNSKGFKPSKDLVIPSESEHVTDATQGLLEAFAFVVFAMDQNEPLTVLEALASLRWSIEEMELTLGANNQLVKSFWDSHQIKIKKEENEQPI